MEENQNIKKKTTKTDTKNKKRKIALRTIIVVIAILVFAILTTISLRTEYLSIKEISEDYTDIFFKNLENEFKVTLAVFMAVYIIVYISNKFIKRGLRKFFEEEKKQLPKLPNKSLCTVLALIASAIGVNLLTEKFSVFINAGVFGKQDPIFWTDIGYYVFTLPFIQSVLIFAIEIFVVLIIYTVLYYVITLNTYFDGVDPETLKRNTLIKQVTFIVFLITLLVCLYLFISSQNILTQNMITIEDTTGAISTELIGAGKTDVTVKLWGYRILSVVIAISVFRFVKYVKKANFKQGIISALIVPIYLVGLFSIMTYFEFVYVKSNELDTEKEYIGYNIKNTKEAYGIDIKQESINEYSTITYDEIKNNQDVINNIPLITKDITSKTVAEHQENSVYYTYENTMIANYKIDGKNSLMYITPREILNDSSMSYNNRTFKYTHGYSAVINSATEADKKGYTEYYLSDFNEGKWNPVTEPRIYFGLETNSIAAINTSFGKEYDYPITATTYEENIYNGKAGLNLKFFDRLILGISNRNYKLAFSSYINEDTKILTNRNILERAKTLLPNIKYDDNPYLVITDEGRLVWVIDGYTVSSAYPYSQTTTITINGYREKINYIRNSVKVIIDAYDGEVTFYITDRSDPIIMTYRNMYPSLFVNLEEEIPVDIVEHIVYPKFLYNIQASMMNIYHEISEDVLYRADDIWQITPKSSSTNSSVVGNEMQPYYTMLKTVDNESGEYGLVLTYNKLAKQNITAYLVGTVKKGQSKLSLYKFGSENNVASIMQLNNQIDQDITISSVLNSLNTTGTKLIKEMFIIPINNTLLYVEPVYQVMLNETEIPVLKKVIVASGNTVAIGDTLDEALGNLFTDYAVDLEFINIEDIEGLIDSVIRANNNLSGSISASDFEMIGKDISNLQSVIRQLETARKNQIEKEALEKGELEKESFIDTIFDTNQNNTVNESENQTTEN